MQRHLRPSVRARALFAVLLLYLTVDIFLIKYYQYRLFPDSTCYISIARQYATGSIIHAINDYWAPLLSWLLVPAVWLDMNPLLYVKLLYAATGLVVIVGFYRLSGRLHLSDKTQIVTLFVLIPVLLHFSLTLITPDFLLVSILIWYFYCVFSTDNFARNNSGLLCGTLGGLAYLCKHYALPFFLAHFILVAIWHAARQSDREQRRRIVRTLLRGITVCLAISGLWIACMSARYGRLTIAPAASYGHALVGPESRGYWGEPRLLKPAYAGAVSAWERPCDYASEAWNPVGSLSALRHKLRISLKCAWKYFAVVLSFSCLSVAILAGYLLLCVPPSEAVRRPSATFLVATTILYSAGYLAISIVEGRYLWIVCLLLLLMGAYLLDLCSRKPFFTPTRQNVGLAVLALSFTVFPTRGLLQEANEGKDLFRISQILQERYKIDGNVATNSEWKKSLYLCFHLNARFYGRTSQDNTDLGLVQELRDNDIDYYLVWRNGAPNAEAARMRVLRGREITRGEIDGLQVFYVKDVSRSASLPQEGSQALYYCPTKSASSGGSEGPGVRSR